MNVCEEANGQRHHEICFEGRNCPLCEMIERYNDMEKELEEAYDNLNELKKAYDELNELNK